MYRRCFYILTSALILTAIFNVIYQKSSIYDEILAYHQDELNARLYDPEMAQGENRKQILRGYELVLETKKNLPNNVGNKLNCVNCHFAGGNSFGGERNGLCLVGVANVYPKIQEDGTPFLLEERINGCFMRSMNGTTIPIDSPEMQAFVAYFEWISAHVPKQSSYPWLGIKPLNSKHAPNPENGKKIYELKCAMCHGSDGRGQERPDDLSYPPLWNENSFNDGAGMNKLPIISYFVYKNMPFGDPGLTIEDSIDVGAYVTSQPRPHLKP